MKFYSTILKLIYKIGFKKCAVRLAIRWDEPSKAARWFASYNLLKLQNVFVPCMHEKCYLPVDPRHPHVMCDALLAEQEAENEANYIAWPATLCHDDGDLEAPFIMARSSSGAGTVRMHTNHSHPYRRNNRRRARLCN